MVAVWNAAFTGRAAVRMPGSLWMEYFLFAKTYFDPQSIIVACEAERIVGFVWSGFGPNDTENALDPTVGVICLLAVAPPHRRQGIGTELLHRAETSLRQHGVQHIFAGPLYPLNPYTFGVYGGSSSPGFLESDALAQPFFEKHGYAVERTCRVFHRSVPSIPPVADARFAAHRLRYEVHANPFQGTTWWQECVLGPVELHEYRLQDKLTGHTAARALLWEMEPYRQQWNQHAIGILDISVPTEVRQQGLAKFLMAQLFRYLQDQFFTLVEVQIRDDNTAALGLMQSLGFEEVDRGHLFHRLCE